VETAERDQKSFSKDRQLIVGPIVRLILMYAGAAGSAPGTLDAGRYGQARRHMEAILTDCVWWQVAQVARDSLRMRR